VDLEAAIARSCNVAAATWAAKVGYESFVDYMRSLGLFRKTELGLPYERTGNFNFEEYNKTLQLANVGFGQSVTCTPVALAGAFAMLANGGVRMEPRLIDEIGTEKQPIRDGVPIVSPETAQRMLDYMEAVIESDSGTGKTLRIPGYRLGGKTGTAQKIGKGQDGYVSNFIGFVPSQSPKAVVLVMVNRPQAGNIYGALVAGPAFHAIAESVIRRYSLPATEPRS
jgi:cell division protein FtsI/penicillin-binding protein 2